MSGIDETYTYCPDCGAIAYDNHSETERLEGEPVLRVARSPYGSR